MNAKNQVRIPVQKRSRETRQHILEAARDMFSRRGYHGANVKEIAKLAGVAVGSFYAYFPDKASLFLEITEGYYREIFAPVRGTMERAARSHLLDTDDGRKMLIGDLVEALYRAHTIEPELHREILLMILSAGKGSGDRGRGTEVYRVVRERVETMDREVQSWIKHIIEGYSRSADPETTAAIVFRTAEETIHRLKLFPQTMPPAEDVLPELARLLHGYLFPGVHDHGH